jgi:hypothetical protein
MIQYYGERVKEYELCGVHNVLGEVKNVYPVLGGKSYGKSTIRRTRHRWKNTIEMNLKVTGCEAMT